MTTLDGLSSREQAACRIAERVLAATAEPWDVAGRQGAVDAMLTLADGRRAAFEVTVIAERGALQTDSLLGQSDFQWPVAGAWWWTIQVGSPSDIPRLRECYVRVAQLCESAGVTRPEALWHRDDCDEDIRWLVEDSSAHMFGHPDVPAVDGDKVRETMVTPRGRGGAVDRNLVGLTAALTDAFESPHIARHIQKLARADGDELHLFIPLHFSALPYPVADGLWTGTTLPRDPAPLPSPLTHLWLAPQFGRRVLLWTPRGWQQHHPYDN